MGRRLIRSRPVQVGDDVEMGDHQGAGAVRVAGAHRLGQLDVAAQGALGGGEVALQLGVAHGLARRGLERLQQMGQQALAGDRGEAAVEQQVGLDPGSMVRISDAICSTASISPATSSALARAAARPATSISTARRQGELRRRDAVGAGAAWRTVRLTAPPAQRLHHGRPAVADGDDALHRQPGHGLAHHRLGHGEALGQRRLGRQRLARVQPAGGDVVEDAVDDRGGEAVEAAPHLSQALVRCAACRLPPIVIAAIEHTPAAPGLDQGQRTHRAAGRHTHPNEAGRRTAGHGGAPRVRAPTIAAAAALLLALGSGRPALRPRPG